MNLLSIILAIILCCFQLTLPRQFFLLPIITAACFVPMNQNIMVFDLHFTVLRLLILVGFIRVIMRGETRDVPWNKFDKLILIWAIIGSLIYIVQQANFNAIIYKSGVMFDCLGTYWLLRQMVRDWADIFQAVKLFAVFAIITAPFIALEKLQGSNFFSIFGPVTGKFHRGRFRAAGPFPHYIMMGCFWASLLPFFYASIKMKKNIILYSAAILAALSSIYFSSSSTPLLTLASLIFFWKIYKYRIHGKIIFWGVSLCLLILHLIMKKPVWHLMARIDIFDGSTGYHRYFLFDNFINHMTEWILLGTKSTSHWGWVQDDLTNQFVLEGVRGGMITLLIFIVIIYCSVKIPGEFSLASKVPEEIWMSWAICVAMLGHFVTFWGVSYFGQMNMLLYLAFALVGFSLEKNNELVFIPITSTK